MAYGVNIESISIIVSAFILGLGTGALAGGFLSRLFPSRLPLMFLICELGIGIFGFFSYSLISYTASLSQHLEGLTLSVIIYSLLLVPTICMGATFPILLEHLHSREKIVGRSVANLYFLNTIGSAIASIITTNIFLAYFTLKITCYIAVALNFLVGFLVYHYAVRRKRKTIQDKISLNKTAPDKTAPDKINVNSSLNFTFIYCIFLSAVVGFISLSQEIIWVRMISYFTGSKANVFGNVLGFFLAGVAFGSLKARNLVVQHKERLPFVLGIVLFISAMSFYLMPPAAGYISAVIGEGALAFLMIFVMLNSFLMGIIFPLLSQYAIHERQYPGFYVSLIYFANIIGSTAGPLFTGLLLFDTVGLEDTIFLFGIFTFVLAVLILIPDLRQTFHLTSSGKTRLQKKLQKKHIFTYASMSVLLFSSYQFIFTDFWEKFHFKHRYLNSSSFKHTIQNKSGVINIIESGRGDDIILGSGVYDGRFNTDPFLNSNGITRAYMLAALHPAPKKILVIGLSGGSWVKAAASHQSVEHIDIVEINPGYLELISKYPDSAAILSDQRIKIHIDDGRRWLVRNSKEKYDFILMNTTFHWRSQTNNLVSYEFLDMVKSRMKPGGVMYYNTTESKDIPFTAAHIFKYCVTYRNFLAVSDSPFSQSIQQKKENLLKYVNEENEPILSDSDLLDSLASADLENQRSAWLRKKGFLKIITDNNLVSEFKSTTRYYVPQKNWFSLLWDYLLD